MASQGHNELTDLPQSQMPYDFDIFQRKKSHIRHIDVQCAKYQQG